MFPQGLVVALVTDVSIFVALHIVRRCISVQHTFLASDLRVTFLLAWRSIPPLLHTPLLSPLGKPASDAILQKPFPMFEKPCRRMCTTWENTFLTSQLRTEQDPTLSLPLPRNDATECHQPQYPGRENHSARELA